MLIFKNKTNQHDLCKNKSVKYKNKRYQENMKINYDTRYTRICTIKVTELKNLN